MGLNGVFLIHNLELNADVKVFLFILFYSNRLFVQEKPDPSVMHQRNTYERTEDIKWSLDFFDNFNFKGFQADLKVVLGSARLFHHYIITITWIIKFPNFQN